ncbi:hypothetical protein ACFQX4_26240 [Roseomonas sp. GCM10028921]
MATMDEDDSLVLDEREEALLSSLLEAEGQALQRHHGESLAMPP